MPTIKNNSDTHRGVHGELDGQPFRVDLPAQVLVDVTQEQLDSLRTNAATMRWFDAGILTIEDGPKPEAAKPVSKFGSKNKPKHSDDWE